MTNGAYNTVVEVVRASSQKAQLVHNEEIKDVDTDQIIADEIGSFVKKSAPQAAEKIWKAVGTD